METSWEATNVIQVTDNGDLDEVVKLVLEKHFSSACIWKVDPIRHVH